MGAGRKGFVIPAELHRLLSDNGQLYQVVIRPIGSLGSLGAKAG